MNKSAEDVLKHLGARSMLWVSDPKEINRLQHVAVEQSRAAIPVLFGLDVIHGYHTIFPRQSQWLLHGIRRWWKKLKR